MNTTESTRLLREEIERIDLRDLRQQLEEALSDNHCLRAEVDFLEVYSDELKEELKEAKGDKS